ncbi:alcohol dehydrogenase [Marasmius fiardii PR-910]|nr:alcohol dehydrogenase [Marasmius fiardii PR-910]
MTALQKAVRWYPPKYDIRVELVPIPEIKEPDDAIVKVKLAGLCGSDLHTYRGHEGEDLAPHICGHEFVGEVVQLGSSFGKQAPGRPDLYSTLQIGDKVLSPFATNCGESSVSSRPSFITFTCRCPRGLLLGCPALDGEQAQYLRVPNAGGTLYNLSDPRSWSNLLPDVNVAHALSTISDSSLLFIGDILPTGLFATIQALNHPKLAPVLTGISWPPRQNASPITIPADDRTLTFAVVGLGPVGICASASRREKMEKIYSQIPNQGQGEFVVRPVEDAKATVKEWTSGTGCTAVLEVVGNSSALTLSYELVQPFGVISSVVVHGRPQLPFTGGNAYDKNVSFDFGRCPARAMFPMAFELIGKGPDFLCHIPLIDRIVGLDEAKEIYRVFDKGEVGKVIFNPWE